MKKDVLFNAAKTVLKTVLNRGNRLFFLSALAAFLLLFGFFYGVYIMPVIELGFIKEEPNGFLEYGYVALASIFSAIIVTLLKSAGAAKSINSSAPFAGIGVLGGSFGAVCPVCLGVNALVFGSIFSVTLASLMPYLKYIQLGSLAFLLAGVWLAAKGSLCDSRGSCKSVGKRRKK